MAVDAVCHHLALVAIYAATDEVALTLDPAFKLYIDGMATDRWGYVALIEAREYGRHGLEEFLEVKSIQQ